ncbi:uncharacterized protein LOC135711940 [Ochlerotatus camptorhynchus]|uniref:uncharacterized protein LOC135711940 n=1 Tax=Ochlerotatus camptorhynchus TaxID=644619 RepID=UPI0031DBD758
MGGMNELRDFLGIKILRDREQGIMKLSQTGLVEKILDRFGMSDCKPSQTPAETRLQLKRSSERCEHPYRELIGCLVYLMMDTRPDLCFIVGPKNAPVVGFVDADFANDEEDRKCVSEFLLTVFGCHLLKLNITQLLHHDRTEGRDEEGKAHRCIRDAVDAGRIQLDYVPTQQQEADVLTKCLAAPSFLNLRIGSIQTIISLKFHCSVSLFIASREPGSPSSDATLLACCSIEKFVTEDEFETGLVGEFARERADNVSVASFGDDSVADVAVNQQVFRLQKCSAGDLSPVSEIASNLMPRCIRSSWGKH